MSEIGQRPEAHSPQNHQLIVSLFGLYSRQHQGAIQIATLVTLMKAMGVEAPATRSSISRLKKRGVIESVEVRGRNGYRLSPSVLKDFEEGDQRIYHPRRAATYDRWFLATFTVPESKRNIRHRIRTALTRMGFGSVLPGLWIAPEHRKEGAIQYFRRKGLEEYFEFFLADHLPSETSLRSSVQSWWDLEALDRLYADFLELYEGRLGFWEGQLRENIGVERDRLEAHAFAEHLNLVTRWRRLPYSDPGLPAEYLPDDWNALRAEIVFRELDRCLAPIAALFAESVISKEF